MKLPEFARKPLNAGVCISFVGTLPVGVLNSCVFALSYSRSVGSAFSFASGVTVTEMVYLYLSLQILPLMNWNVRQERWIYLGMTLFLAVCTSFAVGDMFSATPALNDRITGVGSPFFAGLSLSAVNMLQIPFWVGWNLILKNMGILTGSRQSKQHYLLGSGIGTLAGFGVFVLLGAIAQNSIDINPIVISCIVTAIFSLSTIVAAIKSLQLFKKERKSALGQTV